MPLNILITRTLILISKRVGHEKTKKTTCKVDLVLF